MVDSVSYFGSSDFLIEVVKGNVPKHSIINTLGSNDAVTTTLSPVALGGVYQTPSTLTSVEIVSTDNVRDVAGGTGARTVEVTGLSTGWTEITETIALNGTTAVSLVNQFYRIYKMRVKDSGSYASATVSSHNSTISVQTSGGGVLWGKIAFDSGFGFGSSEIGVFSIPKGVTGYLLYFHSDIESSKSVNLVGYSRINADVVTAPYESMRAWVIKRNISAEHGNIDIASNPIVGPADIGFMAKVSQGNAAVEVEFMILCVED